jgi:hypothetical protein
MTLHATRRNQMGREMPKWGTKEWLQFVQENETAFAALPRVTFDKDGLVRCEYLTRETAKNTFTLRTHKGRGVVVVASSYAQSVASYISVRQYLWEVAAIRVLSGPRISSRAPMFGVPFRRAVEIALQNGLTKCEFYLPERKDDVYYASLLFHVDKRKESNGSVLVLQVWQYCPGLPEVFYIHAESSNFEGTVSHLDGAIIHFPPEEIETLFKSGDKLKSLQYEKQFRLNGEIPMEDMLNIVSEYFPVKELVDEAFRVRTV